ncbi:MAG: PQQ-binding-like beta-propeller repeat protein [Phycisphaerales bacterium]|nr:PQQ-binding-like beta-propeller repeat protein [Phycisphaerales bacterium]
MPHAPRPILQPPHLHPGSVLAVAGLALALLAPPLSFAQQANPVANPVPENPQPAPPENPVFINDSPVATETLSRLVEHLASSNTEQAVRLTDRLLQEEPRALVPSATDPAVYVTARDRVHAALRSSPATLAAWQDAVAPRVAQLADARDWAPLERSYFLSPEGLRATLALARQAIGQARFHAARLLLQQAADHPDLPAQRQDAAQVGQLLARYLPELSGGPLLASLQAQPGPPAPAPPAAFARAISPLDPMPATELDDVVAMPVRTVRFAIDRELELPRVGPGSDLIPREARQLRSVAAFSGDLLLVSGPNEVVAIDRRSLGEAWRTDVMELAGMNPANEREAQDQFRFARRQMSSGLPEELTTVTMAAGGAIVLATTESFDPRTGENVQAVAALDARTGRALWVRFADMLDEQFGRGTAVRGPILVDGDVAVLTCRKAQPDRRLTALYLLGVNVFTGERLWTSLVGSAGSLPFFRSTSVSDGGVIHRGVVYRSDKVGVVAAYSAVDGRPLWVHRLAAEPLDNNVVTSGFAMNVPVIVPDPARGPDAGWLFTVSPDRRRVLKLDLQSGSLAAAVPAEALASPNYLLLAGEHLLAVSDRQVASVSVAQFAALSQTPANAGTLVRSNQPMDLPGIRGRVAVLQSAAGSPRVLVPTISGVEVLAADAPDQPAKRLPLDSAGNVLATGRELVVVDDGQIHAHMAWSAAAEAMTAQLAERPADPAPAVLLADMAWRSGRGEQVPELVGRAGTAMARAAESGDPAAIARATEQRRKLADAVLTMVEWTQDAPGLRRVTPVRPALTAAAVAPALQAVEPMLQTPEQRLAHAMASALAEQTAGRNEQAADRLQAVLASGELSAAVYSGPRLAFSGAAEAERRLRALFTNAGRACYARHDADAAQAAATLAVSTEPTELEAAAARWTVSASAPAILLRLADVHTQQDRTAAAGRALEATLRSAKALGDASAVPLPEIAGRLVQNLADRGLLTAAADVIRRAEPLIGNQPLTVAGQPVDMAALRQRLSQQLAVSQRWPAIGRPTGQGARVLSGWALLEPLATLQGGAGAAGNAAQGLVAMRHEDGRVAIFAGGQAKPAELRPLVTSQVGREAELLRLDATSAVFVSRQRATLSRLRTDGAAPADDASRLAWTTKPFDDHFPTPRPGAMRPGVPDRPILIRSGGAGAAAMRSFDELLAVGDEQSLMLVERTGRTVAFDVDSGQPLWTLQPSDKAAAAPAAAPAPPAPPPAPAGQAAGDAPPPDNAEQPESVLATVIDARAVGGRLVLAGMTGAPNQTGAATGVPAVQVIDARTGKVALTQVLPPQHGAVRWLRATDRGDLVVAQDTAVTGLEVDTARTRWTLAGHPAAATLDAYLVGESLLLYSEDRLLWFASPVTGQVAAAPLDTRARMEGRDQMDARGPSRMVAVDPRLGSSSPVALSGPRGVVVLSDRGEVVGMDAFGGEIGLGGRDTLLPAIPVDKALVTMSVAGTRPAAVLPAAPGGRPEAGNGDGNPPPDALPDTEQVYRLFILDSLTGMATSVHAVAMPSPPSRLVAIPNALLVTAGHSTLVLPAPTPASPGEPSAK